MNFATENTGLAWLLENGTRELEHLFQAIVYHPSSPILMIDDAGNARDASVGMGKLLGLPREKVIGHPVDEFLSADIRHESSQLWKALQDREEMEGTLQLAGADGTTREVEFIAKANVLPVRHIVALRDKSSQPELPPPWVQDYAFYLLNVDGVVVAWYSGARRMYGYAAEVAIGREISFVYPANEALASQLREEFKRAAAEGHIGAEGWQLRESGAEFWANTITMALKDEAGTLQGFARVVRDFDERHEQDEALRHSRGRVRPVPEQSTIAGVVSGEFDKIPEANDAFLRMVGYTREDLLAGKLRWPDLTPPEFTRLDDLAHEEGLRFGACTPFEKQLIRKDGTRIPVLVSTAVLQLSPFRWITFVQDLRQRTKFEAVENKDGEPNQDFGEIVGDSRALRLVQQLVEVVAPTDATVLILGETGTGKELVARAVHRLSPRKNLPFVTLNCAAIPTGLLESELFGYERGAFTGALSQKIGRFEMAHRGTLFLDEVGDIPLDLQPKLLRALQEKSFERLGGTKTIPIDVRLVAATNRNLTEMMGNKLFRSDLYYRLKVFPITTPPLRERPEDIPLLVRHFTKKYSMKMDRLIETIPSETMKALTSWPWPGNIRELENFIERSVILSRGPTLRAPLDELVPDTIPTGNSSTLEHVEREHILSALRESDGVISTAATRLGIPRTTLNARMRKLGIQRGDI